MNNIENLISLNKSPAHKPELSVIDVNSPGVLKFEKDKSLISEKKSVNFGPGLELLMNPKKTASSPRVDIKLDDLVKT